MTLKNGTYRDRDGALVTVTSTETGYLLRWADGRVVELRR